MNVFIGTKLVQAFSMTRQEYNNFRGWQLPANENGNDPGYLVVYPDSEKNTEQYEGYVSWSPKKQFEEAYTDLGDISHLPPFKQRLVGELAQLKEKIRGLGKFFKGPDFLKLHFLDRSKLEEQHRAMGYYKDILAQRIKKLIPE